MSHSGTVMDIYQLFARDYEFKNSSVCVFSHLLFFSLEAESNE